MFKVLTTFVTIVQTSQSVYKVLNGKNQQWGTIERQLSAAAAAAAAATLLYLAAN